MADNDGQERCHGGCNVGRPASDGAARAWDAVARPPVQCESARARPARPEANPQSLFDKWEAIASHIEAIKLTDKEAQPFTLSLDAAHRAFYRMVATDWEKGNSRILTVAQVADTEWEKTPNKGHGDVAPSASLPPATPILNGADTVIAYCRMRNNTGVFWLYSYDINGNRINTESIGELKLEDSIGNEILSTIATMGFGAIVGAGRGALAALGRGALMIIRAGFTRFTAGIITWQSGKIALVRLGKSAANILQHELVRNARALTRPETFRHILTADIPSISFANIEKSGAMLLSKGGNAHYGEGVYAFAAGKGGKSVATKFIEIEVPAGTAVETLAVKNAVTNTTDVFVRLVPAQGDSLAVKIVGTNLTQEEIAFGRAAVARFKP